MREPAPITLDVQWVSDANDRLRAHIAAAVASDRLNLASEVYESQTGEKLGGTEAAVYAASHVIGLWNERADKIDAKFGKGFFGLRLGYANAYTIKFIPEFPGGGAKAYSVLTFLSATERTPIIDWMFDLMTIAGLVPESRIHNEATAKNGLWDRKLRKQRRFMALKWQSDLEGLLADDRHLADRRTKLELAALRRLPLHKFDNGEQSPPVTSPQATSHPGMTK